MTVENLKKTKEMRIPHKRYFIDINAVFTVVLLVATIPDNTQYFTWQLFYPYSMEFKNFDL